MSDRMKNLLTGWLVVLALVLVLLLIGQMPVNR